MKSDVEAIDAAIALVERDGGWCQGALVTFQVCKANETPMSFCLEGAIGFATGYMRAMKVEDLDQNIGYSPNPYIRYQWARLIKEVAREAGVHLPRAFNDDSHTSQEDVVLVLKHVRERLRDNAEAGR